MTLGGVKSVALGCDGERKWQPTLKTYKRQEKAGSNAQALIWDVSDDGVLSWDLA